MKLGPALVGGVSGGRQFPKSGSKRGKNSARKGSHLGTMEENTLILGRIGRGGGGEVKKVPS